MGGDVAVLLEQLPRVLRNARDLLGEAWRICSAGARAISRSWLDGSHDE